MTLPGILASGGLAPGAPTIGTATDGGNGTSVNVAFTAPSWVGKGTGTVTYTATSSPGGLTGTSTSSPVTVSGLTTGTAYTFTVRATTSYGVSGPSSASSNSVTPSVPTSFDSISSATGTGGNTSITFSSIPQTYKHLQLRISARRTGSGSNNNYIVFTINGNNSSIYTNKWVLATSGGSPAINVQNDNTNTFIYGNRALVGSGAVSGLHSVMIIDILNYASTTVNKNFRMISGVQNNSSTSSNQLQLGTGTPLTTSAITSITLAPEPGNGWAFQTGSTFALYGIRG